MLNLSLLPMLLLLCLPMHLSIAATSFVSFNGASNIVCSETFVLVGRADTNASNLLCTCTFGRPDKQTVDSPRR